MTFGIVGYGTVGRATREAAEFHGHECVAVIDPAITIGPTLGPSHVASTAALTCNADGQLREADFAFICVDTPSRDDGSCDTSKVEAAVADLFERGYGGTIVIRSTVPPGTCRDLAAKHCPHQLGRILHNPEFLRRRDIQHTSRWPGFVVIGGCNPWWDLNTSRQLMSFYEPYFDSVSNPPIFYTTWETSEFYKYASNALLALTVAGAEQLYDVAQEVGANWQACFSIAQRCYATPKTVRVDPKDRGFAGPCLPKDLDALLAFAPEGALSLFRRAQAFNTDLRAWQEGGRNHPTEDRGSEA